MLSSTSTLLADGLQGRVIEPGHPDYDEARKVFSGAIDRRPSAIVRVANADDVARVIAHARGSGLELAVRSGGHSGAGHGVTDGGIVIDLSEMKALEIDPFRRTAWAETGLTAGEYATEAGKHGLATGFGDTGTVGIGGITLGGGVGFLARKHGLTIDDLLAAEVVTADGDLLYADGETYPDLFWAIRGGGGNFGVATRFKFRLHPVESFVGGILFLPATPEVVAGFVAEAAVAPEELSTIANVMTAPPFLPEELHGQLVVMAIVAYAGEVEDGKRAIAPLRALAEPIADMVRPMSYAEMYPPEEEEYHPVAAAKTMFVDSLGLGAAETIVERIQESSAMMAATQIRVLGGAVARVPADATAYAQRGSRIMLNVAALYQSPEERRVHEEWVNGLADELLQDDAGAYVGFLADEGEARVRAAYPGPTWDRLRQVKRRYDPDNVFRLNQNIPPADEAGS
jgi:FAD/FMN-containing dehydrogenase